MAKIVKLNNMTSVLEARIADKLSRYTPKNPGLARALLTIGAMIETEAKMNIRRKQIVDTGTLMNSIKFRLYKQGIISGVVVGSFGVPYAAAHEFGFDGNIMVTPKTMRTKAFGKATKPYLVAPYRRRHHVRARPYLRPAVKKLSGQIQEIIKGLRK